MASSVATPLERAVRPHRRRQRDDLVVSTLGTTSITLQFDLNRDINGAARDVEAGINAARTYLPANLPANPSYRKVNPADSPILLLGLQSDIYDVPTLYDEASTVIAQRISQITGVGQVSVVGASLPAVRIELNPVQLASYGISLPAVQQVVAGQNSNLAKGQIADGNVTADIIANDQISKAADYKPLVVGYHNGGVVRLQDVADVIDSQQTVRQAGFLNGKPSVDMLIFRQPGANIITTVDAVKAAIPSLQAIDSQRRAPGHHSRPHPDHPRLGHRYRDHPAHLGAAGGRWSSSFFCAMSTPRSSPRSPFPSRSSAPAPSCTCAAFRWTTSR